MSLFIYLIPKLRLNYIFTVLNLLDAILKNNSVQTIFIEHPHCVNHDTKC